MSIRILIADDHGVIRAGLRALLSAEPDFEVVGEAQSGKEVLDLSEQLQPGIVLLDISMPGMGGIEIARRLKRKLPEVYVLILTVHEDDSLLQEAIQAGAAGYIVKRAAESELIDAIRAVWRGDIYVHPAMTRALLKDKTSPPITTSPPQETPTPREIDVLRLIAQGYTNRQAAEALSISPRTVEGHRANLMSKLNLRSRVELIRYARKNGYID